MDYLVFKTIMIFLSLYYYSFFKDKSWCVLFNIQLFKTFILFWMLSTVFVVFELLPDKMLIIFFPFF